MARRVISLDEKIEKAQEYVATTKAKYEEAVNALEKLLRKRQEQDNKKLLEAFAASDKSLDEVIRFTQADTSVKNGEDDE